MLWLSVFSIIAIFRSVKWYLIAVLTCTSLMASNIASFHVLMGYLYLLWENVYLDLCPLLILVVFLSLSCNSLLCILDIGILSSAWFAKFKKKIKLKKKAFAKLKLLM